MDGRQPRRIYEVKHLDTNGKVLKVTTHKELRKRGNPFRGKARALPVKRKTAVRKKLVKNATFAEKLFKHFLRDAGINFRFQKIIHVGGGHYRYADFYLPALKWIIEIDGAYHGTPEQCVLDRKRADEILEVRPGFDIVRYTNKEVTERPEKIFEAIMARMRDKFNLSVEEIRERNPRGEGTSECWWCHEDKEDSEYCPNCQAPTTLEKWRETRSNDPFPGDENDM